MTRRILLERARLMSGQTFFAIVLWLAFRLADFIDEFRLNLIAVAQ
jgi:hypothetical protein